MSGRGSYETVLGAFGEGRIDVLIGTQMIAKGHDIPNVTLVCVVNADIGRYYLGPALFAWSWLAIAGGTVLYRAPGPLTVVNAGVATVQRNLTVSPMEATVAQGDHPPAWSL